ncbi:MAG: thioredoxin domain-containing protein [Gemmatimonadota bacterium]|jgi:uncharacterized protein YyaL (SSP411 family)|nr:thioredoxin domain-containing protein [Gemmatimonadota bacterium]
MPNRLAFESSPYLQQHRDNPVDWYPWGEEALNRALTEDRPILLSVGYSACHWCHVMEHESFSDPEIAELMNRYFINIKVDREERPDVDALYMHAVRRMTGDGGWPMTVFLTPEGVPFHGGTYFPPRPRHGLPSFRQLLEAVHHAFSNQRREIETAAVGIRNALATDMRLNPDPAAPAEHQLHRAFHGVMRDFDPHTAGFGGAPRFPQPMVIDFLLRYHARFDSAEALSTAVTLLHAMAGGGIHDQIGGGFHRYTVDAHWLVPHFEKMLYDNVLLARAYTRAAQVTSNPEFGRTARSTLEYLLREMHHRNGGFFSSQDADSEGSEGRFYVWASEEINSLLDPGTAALVRDYWNITPTGNWEGTNILNTSPGDAREAVAAAAEARGLTLSIAEEKLDTARRILYEARSRRVHPGRDEKILTGWNALALHAFAEAGRVFRRDDFTRAAESNARFLLSELWIDGVLHRAWRDGVARIPAFLEDYAMLVDALVELYRTTFNPRWIREARLLADTMINRFWSADEDLFFDTSATADPLIVRPRDPYDNATPSGSSAAAHALTRLGRLTGVERYDQIAGRVTMRMAETASRFPRGFAHLLATLSTRLAPPTEVALIGDPADQGTRDLLDVINSRFLPDTVVALGNPAARPEEEVELPLLTGRTTRGNRPAAYVCLNFSCSAPVTTPYDLRRELDRIPPAATQGAGGS